MQGLADGYFVVPYTMGNFLARAGKSDTSDSAGAVTQAVKDVQGRIQRLIDIGQKGSTTPDAFHRKMGAIIWDKCGMSRNADGLKEALSVLPEMRDQFWNDVKIVGSGEGLNVQLEKAGRVADFLELGELMCHDALDREESCGAHFREEYQSAEGEAKRNDEEYTYVSAWESTEPGEAPILHKEPLDFEYVKLTQRSYK
jgi:succinate dehydrogenase / fumarate reductase flavoprotein subunit